MKRIKKNSNGKEVLAIILPMFSAIPLMLVLIFIGVIIDKSIGDHVVQELWRVISVLSVISTSVTVSGFVVFKYFKRRFRPSWADETAEFDFSRTGKIVVDRSEKS